VSCECGARFKTKAEWAGRTTKCPKCAQPITIPKPAPPEPEATFELEMSAPEAPAESPVEAPAPESPIAEEEAAEEEASFEPAPTAKMQAKQPEMESPSDDPLFPGDGWIDITEAYVSPDGEIAPAATPNGDDAPAEEAGDATDDWGEEILTELEVPDNVREKIQKTLTRGERIVHCVRPDPDILTAQAKSAATIGIFLLIPAPLGLIGAIVAVILMPNLGGFALCGFGLMLAAMLGIPGYYMATMRGRLQRSLPGRACFLLTNRRLIIHHGDGKGPQLGNYEPGKIRNTKMTESYSGNELTWLFRREFADESGNGELFVGRTITDNPGGGNLWAVRDVAVFDRKIRESLLDPVIDRMLRGEIRIKSGLGRKKQAEGEELPVDGNLKDTFAKQGALPTDGNVKTARTAATKDLAKIDAELRERVEAELTKGEKIVWIGEPEGKTKGRGVLGSVLNAAQRIEPDYVLYAITNRRALLFDGKGAGKIGSSHTKEISFGKLPRRGPICYYAPDLLNVGMEDDNRFPNGGAIVFRKTKVTIEHKNQNGKVLKRTYETHYYGILRIANYKTVARLLFETLVRPIKRE
jgi:hypothetical protein